MCLCFLRGVGVALGGVLLQLRLVTFVKGAGRGREAENQMEPMQYRQRIRSLRMTRQRESERSERLRAKAQHTQSKHAQNQIRQ